MASIIIRHQSGAGQTSHLEHSGRSEY